MVPTPHDALFKAVFSRIQHAREVLRAVLPSVLVRHLDWDTLRLAPGSFVDERLRDRHADLLFTIQLEDLPLELFILFEHQSTGELLMPWRVLRYESETWTGYLDDHRQVTQLPGIIPVVLHHGPAPWRAPAAMRQLYALPPALLAHIGGYMPDFTFLLDDLAAQSDQDLRRREMNAGPTLVLWALKHTRHAPDIVAALRTVRDLCLQILRTPADRQTLRLVFRYILEVSKVQAQAMSDFVHTELGPEAEEDFVSAADLLRREGRKESLFKLLSTLLQQRFGPLPEDVRAKLESADGEQLDQWGERVLAANTLADVFAGEP